MGKPPQGLGAGTERGMEQVLWGNISMGMALGTLDTHKGTERSLYGHLV